MRYFNTTGLCVPNMHYMVDISGKLAQIKAMIDKEQYFTINRGRQYGKTTTLNALADTLGPEYIALWISLEGMTNDTFEDESKFVCIFLDRIEKALCFSSVANDKDYIKSWIDPSVTDMNSLSDHITNMCEGRKIVLMIDESDKFSNYRLFISFLGILRDKFLRRTAGKDYTFHSVILAGVYDIKNIKNRMITQGKYTPHEGESTVYNSPWNIAVNFNVDMSFSAPEIATMLNEYEGDHQSGMDIKAISEELRAWTSGYPFLVSRLCQIIDGDLDKDWTIAGVKDAVRLLVREMNTLFDDMGKNMEMFPALYQFTYDLLILGEEKRESFLDPVVGRGFMFGYFRSDNGKVLIANQIFAKVLTDYFLSKDDTTQKNNVEITGVFKTDVVKDGHFDMELTLHKFAQHYNEIFTRKDSDFWEKHARLVFLTYLKPLINGEGFYHLESQFTDLRRMDIVVDYGKDQFIIELKMWHGDAYEEKAYQQLTDYLQSKHTNTGYLLTFDMRKDKQAREGWIEKNGCLIFEVVL
ncbi:MAG: hypothetical protein LBM77_03710 [Spirochaetaceae bacterium]|nr:hypothetical protein [Spirochaetaceae bacterium]